LKLTGEVAQRVFADKLFQTTGAECLKAQIYDAMFAMRGCRTVKLDSYRPNNL